MIDPHSTLMHVEGLMRSIGGSLTATCLAGRFTVYLHPSEPLESSIEGQGHDLLSAMEALVAEVMRVVEEPTCHS